MEFERKEAGFQSSSNITDEIIELRGERIVGHQLFLYSSPSLTNVQTNAMVISTQHLMPAAPKESQDQKVAPATQEGTVLRFSARHGLTPSSRAYRSDR